MCVCTTATSSDHPDTDTGGQPEKHSELLLAFSCVTPNPYRMSLSVRPVVCRQKGVHTFQKGSHSFLVRYTQNVGLSSWNFVEFFVFFSLLRVQQYVGPQKYSLGNQRELVSVSTSRGNCTHQTYAIWGEKRGGGVWCIFKRFPLKIGWNHLDRSCSTHELIRKGSKTILPAEYLGWAGRSKDGG